MDSGVGPADYPGLCHDRCAGSAGFDTIGCACDAGLTGMLRIPIGRKSHELLFGETTYSEPQQLFEQAVTMIVKTPHPFAGVPASLKSRVLL